jgi:hypothetical protein
MKDAHYEIMASEMKRKQIWGQINTNLRRKYSGYNERKRHRMEIKDALRRHDRQHKKEEDLEKVQINLSGRY